MDILSSDLLFSFFNSALQSYKHDSLLRPFPPGFLTSTTTEKDFMQLIETVDFIPQFSNIDWNNTKNFDGKALKLLKWVIKPKRFIMKVSAKETLKHISYLVGEEEKVLASEPQYIFEVIYSELEEEKFTKIRNGRDLLYAYHGSRTENFHSILRTGLRNNMNKVSLFGEGIYLSRDLRVCMTYSPASSTWKHSLLGDSVSCVAVCEIIDHPDVKCSVKRSLSSLNSTSENEMENTVRHRNPEPASASETVNSNTGNQGSDVKTSVTERKRSFIKGSLGGEIPDKYYVVRNDDHIRVKYLLVYAPKAQKELIRKLASGLAVSEPSHQPGFFRSFVTRHKFFFVMLFYCFILLVISVFNSKAFARWWRKRTSND